MSELQWLWCYINVLEDEKEEELRWKSRLDYLGWWVNPQLAKSVMKQEKIKNGETPTEEKEDAQDGDTVVVEGDTAVNDDFENELKKALIESGLDENEFTELPDSVNVGNVNESKDDFITRVLANQGLANIPIGIETDEELEQYVQNGDIHVIETPDLEKTVKDLGLSMADIDFFEFPEEE